jgi:hypothetical protein
MISENNVEKQFQNLLELLKYSAKIVRKIFTPDAFNYHFLYGEYDGHEVFENYNVLQYWKTGQLSPYADRISQEDIRKGSFKLPDGIYPITKITEKLDLRAYMISRDKEKLGPYEVRLEVILGPEEVKKIEIFYNKGDKIFIKNWEKVFGDDVSVLRSDTIFFLISQNRTLEIRTFSLEENGVKMKFGIDLIPSLIPFGESPVIWQYKLSNLFFDLIISFLWNKDEDDKNKILTGIRNLVDKLWTDEMFKARREFLYINTRVDWEADMNIHNVLEGKKELLDEMRTNPRKYLPQLSPDTKKMSFRKIVEENTNNLPPSVYLITQYRADEIVLKDPLKRTIVIDDIPDYWDEMDDSIVQGEELKKWRIRFIYSWPTSKDTYLTLFHINLPFNPYILYNKEIVYIPDEISDIFLDNMLKIEPRIQRWIEETVKKDKEEIYKRLENLLNEIRTGNVGSYTIWAFDDAGEEHKDKRKRMEFWEKEWKELEKESQTSESKRKEKKEKRKEKKEGPIIEVYSGLSKREYDVVQPKQEEISETSESKEEKQQLKQKEEISKKEEKTFEEPKLQKEEEKQEKEEKQEEEIYATSMKSMEEQEKQEVKIDEEQERTKEKPKLKKEEKQETQIDKEQMETTEKPMYNTRMIPEYKIEERFERLIDYLKWSAKIVRKIFTPEAFNYPFWFPLFEKDERIPRSKISYTDIQKGKFVFPDGIHPIIEVVQNLDLVEYIKTGDKKKLKRNVNLRVMVKEENVNYAVDLQDITIEENVNYAVDLQDITIVDDGTDKNFIKNWEKVFGEEIFLLRSDIILFLVVKNGTLEIRSFSMSKDNLSNNYGEVNLTKWDYDRVKFGVDLLIDGNISPFGNTKIKQRYFLSYLFLYEIIYFLRLYDLRKNDKKDIENFAKALWTDDMFFARRKFLYINSINLEENKNLLEIWEEKKRLLNEIRTNPDKYLTILSQKPSSWTRYEDLLSYNKGERIFSGLYLITQYRINSEAPSFVPKVKTCNCIVLKRKYYGDEIVIYNMPETLVNYYKGLVDTKDKNTGKIGLVFSWPLGDWHENYLTFFSINSPFNPYIEKDGNLYIPDEIAELLLDAIEPEPKIAKWIKAKAKEDQEALYKRLYDVLYELDRGELSNDTVYMFDNTGEEDADKRKRMESWKKEWEKLTEEIQTYEQVQTVEPKTEEIQTYEQVQTVEPKDEGTKDKKDEGTKDKEILEKVKQYLNSEEYKQEIVSALQQLLEENPEYKKFNEFVREYYPKLLERKNVPREVHRWKEEYWLYDKEGSEGRILSFYKETDAHQLRGVYLLVYKWYEKVPLHDYNHQAYVISRKGVDRRGNERFYVQVIGEKFGVRNIPYTVNGLVYFVFFNKNNYYFITTELPRELYTYLYCGTSEKSCIWMPEMVLKAIWPIFEKMAEKIKREVFEVIEDNKPKISEDFKLHKEEVKIDEEQERTKEKPKLKKEEKQETQIDKEQMETTEKPKHKKKEEKISEPQQEKEKKEKKVEEKTESKKTTEEITEEIEEIKEQDIMEELEGADVEMEAKVKSKVHITLPKKMVEDLIVEKPKSKTVKNKKSKKSKGASKRGKSKRRRKK